MPPVTRRFVHGQRVIYPAPSKYDDRYSGVVNILDFSRAAVQTSSATRDPSRRNLPFLEVEVASYLPFARSTLTCKYEYSVIMLYGDGIVGISVRLASFFFFLSFPSLLRSALMQGRLLFLSLILSLGLF
jgi:hypothetical protein